MIKTNLIIIGAHHGNEEDFNNNPRQADILDLIFFKENMKNKLYDVSITCIDPMYSRDDVIDTIEFKKTYYNLGDTSLFSVDNHNIILEFANILDENHINHGEFNKQYENIVKYVSYKFTWISCGCSWDKYFPQKLLETIILRQLYTPVTHNKESFLYAVKISKDIDEHPIFFKEVMQPYSQGIYQSLGTLYWRGCASDSYKNENVLRDLFKDIQNLPEDLSNEEINNFISNKIHWNELSRKTRELATQYIYGSNILKT